MICSDLSQLEILTYCLDLFSLYTTLYYLLWSALRRPDLDKLFHYKLDFIKLFQFLIQLSFLASWIFRCWDYYCDFFSQWFQKQVANLSFTTESN